MHKIFNNKTKQLKQENDSLKTQINILNSKISSYNKLFYPFFMNNFSEFNLKSYIIHVSSNGEILDIKGDIDGVLGWSNKIIGSSIKSITHSEDGKKIQGSLTRQLNFNGEIRRLDSNNTYKWVYSNIIVMKDDASTIFFEWDLHKEYTKGVNDIQNILNNIPNMAYIKDANGIFCAVNNIFAETCRQDHSFFKGRNSKLLWKSNDLFQCMYSNDQAAHVTDVDIHPSQLNNFEWPDGITRDIQTYKYELEDIHNKLYSEFTKPLYLYILQNEHHTKQKGTQGAHFRCTYNRSKQELLITYTSKDYEAIVENNKSNNNIFNEFVHHDDLKMFLYTLNQSNDHLHPWRWQGRISCYNQTTQFNKRVSIIAWPVKQTGDLDMLGIIQDLTNQVFERKINNIFMRHTNDVLGYHIYHKSKPFSKQFSHSVEKLIGYHSSEIKDNFWLMHPDDCKRVNECLKNVERGLSDVVQYRIKHKNNHWVNVSTQFIPFDDGFCTITNEIKI